MSLNYNGKITTWEAVFLQRSGRLSSDNTPGSRKRLAIEGAGLQRSRLLHNQMSLLLAEA